MGVYYIITTINLCIWTPLQTLRSLLNNNNPSTVLNEVITPITPTLDVEVENGHFTNINWIVTSDIELGYFRYPNYTTYSDYVWLQNMSTERSYIRAADYEIDPEMNLIITADLPISIEHDSLNEGFINEGDLVEARCNLDGDLTIVEVGSSGTRVDFNESFVVINRSYADAYVNSDFDHILEPLNIGTWVSDKDPIINMSPSAECLTNQINYSTLDTWVDSALLLYQMRMKYPQLRNRKKSRANQLCDIVEEEVIEEIPVNINHNWSNIIIDNQHADALVGETFEAYRGTRLPTEFRYLTTDNILDFRYWDIEEISNAEELSTYWADQTYLFTNCTIDILLAIDIFF